MINKNAIPTQVDITNDITGLYVASMNAHDNIVTSFTNINMTYGESSVSEDIVSNSFLSLYNSAKSITNDRVSKNVVVEAFLSQSLVDMEFPVDKKLNMDTQNGTLTLPIISTSNIKVSNVIVETDSNGTPGDSLNGMQNADISSILASNPASLFVYEKIVNSMSLSPLHLSVTLNTENEDIANGIYLKMYADNKTSYPTIEAVEHSLDGNDWVEVSFEHEINKSDYYIRFSPARIRFVRIKLTQNTYNSIDTGFGTRYRYLIGLREVTIKKTQYDIEGKYISVPLSGKKAITNVTFSKEDIGNVRYFLSANNGTKWVEVQDGEVKPLYNAELGLRPDVDINSIRVKVEMNKTNAVIAYEKATEYHITNDTHKYYLNNAPVSIKARVGKHISYGDLNPFSIYINEMQTTTANIFVNNSIKMSKVIPYVPYYDGIQDDIVLRINGSEVVNNTSLWEIQPHSDDLNSVLAIKSEDIAAMSGAITLHFKPYSIQTQSPIIELPMYPFIQSNDGFIIKADSITLPIDSFIVDGDKVTIKDYAFNPEATYSISYFPAIDVSRMLPEKIESNEIAMQSLSPMAEGRVCFEYDYAASDNDQNILYFTPISTQYKVELV